MRNRPFRSKPLLPLAALLALPLFQAGCRQGQVAELETRMVFAAPASPLPGSFSLALAGGTPYLCYTDRESLALLLAAADPPSAPEYLDRITDIPENDALLGSHVLLGGDELLHLLYLDSRTEEKRLLKYLKKDPHTGISWIDVLPETGKPIAAWLEGVRIEIFLERDDGLYRMHYPVSGPVQPVKAPFDAAGPASVIAPPPSLSGGFHGFTVFDRAAQRLLLFYDRAGETLETTVARFGEVHHSCLAEDGTLRILAYDSRSLRIVLFESRDPAQGFQERPVTLARSTTCLALARRGAQPVFLYNEMEVARETRYLLSLLAPGGRNGYRKYLLYQGPVPIRGLGTAQSATSLYVAFQADALRVVRLEVYGLPEP